MGCCSGRCTLAFICGMQLVSVGGVYCEKKKRRGSGYKKALIWLLTSRGARNGGMDRWMAGRRKTNAGKVTFDRRVKGHDVS